ncbi:MAG: HepT-like ribonuclease domain-containing protein [Chloroflexota bacterium]
MREYTREAIELSGGRSRADLDRDRLLNLALVRLCELIGEAASKVPVEVQERHSRIPWRQIVSFRNRLIHGYDSVDLDIVWQVITVDLPPLLAALDAALSEDPRSS